MAQTIRRGFRDMLAEAGTRIVDLSVSEALAMRGRDDVTFVDIRDPRELDREGHIPGAFHCPRGMLEFWIDPESPYFKPVFGEDRTFVFFCGSGWRSALATDTAQSMGLKPVAHFSGGFAAWKEAGGPVEGPKSKTG